jgi:1,3-beta-glucan synthase
MVLATLIEFLYIPIPGTTQLLVRRFFFLLVTLAITVGPTFCIAIEENQSDGGGSLALLGIAQFFFSLVATLCSASCPPIGCMVTCRQQVS